MLLPNLNKNTSNNKFQIFKINLYDYNYCYYFTIHRTLDILILNAGVFAVPYTLTEDGYEMIFQVNHLSQFYLTLLLEHPLRCCCNARVVIVSSESHR